MKILVADDDQVSLMMMRRMLLRNGYEVITASDGDTAVEKILVEDGPRLLLLDWMMPKLNGPEVCQAIRTRAERGYVYIVLLTAKDTKDDLVAGLEAGADDYLTKPCYAEELRARLRTGERVLRLEDGLVQVHEEMRFRATHDALTALLNRGAIVEALSAEIQENRRTCGNVSIMLCDVDHFKAINDTYGHLVGDEVLREIARRMRAMCTDTDSVGRFGGEEFLFLLRGCDSRSLAFRANRIREAISNTSILTSSGPLRVSISAGTVSVPGHRCSSNQNQILQRADLLLYQAKKEGRNRVISGVDATLQSPEELSVCPPTILEFCMQQLPAMSSPVEFGSDR